ncbi:hypothetical protein ANCCEY_00857 [Ancylostoma ceylanicum]|nr:hypothetical protein ANCCEY_00857 [Ancylostoma ceylanicum]
MSPDTAAKLAQYRSYIQGQAASLGPEARAFFDELARRRSQTRAQIHAGFMPSLAQIRQARLEAINMYRAMSPAGQADFQRHFPGLAMFFTNDMVYRRLQSMG